MKHLLTKSVVVMILALCPYLTKAQSVIYPQHFDLQEVTLLDGPFKTAMEINFNMLLQYDVDRLLNPYIRQAGLNDDSSSPYYHWSNSHPSFPNWGSSDFNLDGHVGGHYLSAVAMAYAACTDPATKAQLKNKVDYMVDIMYDCQAVYDSNTEGLKGFIGGQPMNDAWKRLYSGTLDLRGTGECAVPWYCQHKILAGIRDAYVYTGSTKAKTMFQKMCDWCILVTSNINDDTMQNMLGTEHGGVNETLLDAYVIFGDTKYLNAAKRFSHQYMLNGMQSYNTTFLDNRHANTQVPKFIGFERIFEADNTATAYRNASENFWNDVAQNRTVCIGGNSVNEHFLAAAAGNNYIDQIDGPESCNTNNMLKLSEISFDRTHDAKYADFYEYATWNHILSTQDPTTGGYVYFTTLRPQAYRIYSQVNQGMWCCVGTGMENHSKYGHFIYTHDGNSKLYVNLFTASELNSDNFKITQNTSFPFSNTTTLTVGKAGTYTIAIRHPWWTTNGYDIKVNGTSQTINVTQGTASYAEINRTWSVGDVITVTLPMQLRYTPCPNYNDYIAFQYGPILLAAQTTAASTEEAAETGLAYEALQNEYAGEGRMDHSPGSRGSSKSLTSAPLLIGERNNVINDRISVNDLSTLTFNIDASRNDELVTADYKWNNLTLKPFYQIHHARYSCYWYQQTVENYANSSMGASEAANAAIATRTLDFVATGEQQSEAGHFSVNNNSTTGSYNNEFFRDARPSDGFVQYTLGYEGEPIESGISILCRFTQADAGRKATLFVDGTPIAHITALAEFNGTVSNGFYNVEYPIPASLMRDENNNIKQSFTIKVAADQGTAIPGLYYIRLMKEYDNGMPNTVTTIRGAVRNVIDGVVTGENGQSEMAHSFGFTGNNETNRNHGTYQNKYWRNTLGGETYSYYIQTEGQTEGVSLVVEYNAADGGRLANIDIDGTTIETQLIDGFMSQFVVLEYKLDPALLIGKKFINVKFTSADGAYSPGTYNVYVTSGRNDSDLGLVPYQFLNTNFEKNGNDGKISSVGYDDGKIQVSASATGNYVLNMRMKLATSGTYSINPNQFLFLIKGQGLATNAYLWWLLGCNHGAQDSPQYTLIDNGETYLVWDLRKVATFNANEKSARFFGTQDIPVSSSNGGGYSLACFGLTSSNSDGSAIISDISFYSPEQLVDKYAALKPTVKSIATSLAADSVFAYDGYIYKINEDNDVAVCQGRFSTRNDYSDLPTTVFGYTVRDDITTNKTTITNNSGNITSLLKNPQCGSTDGWINASSCITLQQSWRNNDANPYIERTSSGTIYQTVNSLPAGTYKVVAALRANTGGQITVALNDDKGTVFTGTGNNSTTTSQINMNGVQMPFTQAAGYQSNESSRGWQWGTATTELLQDGNLTVKFIMNGNSWMSVDDVYLYCTTLNGTSYTTTVSEGTDVANADGKVVTADIILSNPNSIVNSEENVITAAETQMNNNLVDGNINNMVLFDGYNFTTPENAYTATQATLYRNLPADQWCTLVVPFLPNNELTKIEPYDINGSKLIFTEVETSENDKPMLVKSATDVTAITGVRNQTETANLVASGTGTALYGTYSRIPTVTYGNYVVSRGADNVDKIYLVNSNVSLAPFRAFISVDGDVKQKVFDIDFDNPVGINSINLDTIEQNDIVFNLAGQRVAKPGKGIYIINGKKTIIR